MASFETVSRRYNFTVLLERYCLGVICLSWSLSRSRSWSWSCPYCLGLVSRGRDRSIHLTTDESRHSVKTHCQLVDGFRPVRNGSSKHQFNSINDGGYFGPSDKQHLSDDDCLDVEREDNQNCSVLYCVVHTRVSSSYRWLNIGLALRLITSEKEGGKCFSRVCLFVCLLTRYSKTRAWIWMKCCVSTDVGM